MGEIGIPKTWKFYLSSRGQQDQNTEWSTPHAARVGGSKIGEDTLLGEF